MIRQRYVRTARPGYRAAETRSLGGLGGLAVLRRQAPLRPSGPEPLDPGEMPVWDRDAYSADPMAQPVGDAIPVDKGAWGASDPIPMPGALPTVGGGTTANPIVEEERSKRILGLSRNEFRLAVIGGVVLVGFLYFKKTSAPKKNPARRRRRRRR